MREIKIFIAAGIFLALTCVKLLVPGLMDSVRSEIIHQIDRNIDYEAVVVTLAQKAEDYSKYFTAETPMPAPVTTPIPASTPEPVPTSTPTPEVTSAPEPEQSLLPFEYELPLEAVSVSSGFGSRIHPIEGVEKFHYGLDISALSGEEIRSFADGEVTTAEYSDSYGNYVIIQHNDTYSSLYAHCSRLLVSAGDVVQAGDIIALVGQTGLATGPHLHFELHENDICIDPEKFLC